MTSSNFKIGDLVQFKNCFCSYVITAIKGKTATLEPVMQVGNLQDIQKRISSLSHYKEKNCFLSDEERAMQNYTFKDGEKVFSIIQADGQGGTYIWQNGQIVKS